MLLGYLTRRRLLSIGATVLASTLAIGPHSASAEDAKYGTIKGRLVWGGDTVPQLPKVKVPEKDAQACGTAKADADLVIDGRSKGVANGFAYLVRPSGTNPEAEKALLDKTAVVQIDQKACEFIPYSTALHKAQALEFKSSDPVSHNVRYSAFRNSTFNQILPPNGSTKVTLVAEPRPLLLACDIHPWMKGAIMVFDHPFFAVTQADGSFEIQGVPAGTQNLLVWQKLCGYVTPGGNKGMPVKVEPGKVTDVGEIKMDPAKARIPKAQ